MRLASTLTAEFSVAVTLLMVLTFSSNARAQTNQSGTQDAAQSSCGTTASSTTAQNGSAQQNNSSVSAETQNVKNAAKQLGSLFKKKPAASSTTAAAPSPCPAPAASATPNAAAAPANGNANAPAPAPAATSPANASAGAANSPQPSPAASPAPASASTLGGVQLPPAPPGGLDPSKLPDIVGVHIGTPTDKVMAQLNAAYPVIRNDRGTQQYGIFGRGYSKYAPTNDPPYVSSVGANRPFTEGCAGSQDCQSGDQISGIFSGPPEKVLVRLERSVSYGSGRPTTSDNLRAALVQKYGPNFTEYPPMTLNWAFDEEGKALPPPNKPVSCQGIISQQGYPPPNPYSMDSYVGLYYGPGGPPLQQQLVPKLRGRCSFILVTAQISGQPGGSAVGITVVIQELPEDLRAAFAAEAYIHQAANAQSNQQLKDAQQQAAPKF